MNNTKKSLIAILICYFSWGLFPIYFKLLKSIDAYEVLAMRVLCSFIFMILVVLLAKNKNSISLEIKKIWQNKKSFSLLVLASFLITANWLTYIIAVNTNHVLEASFGYYLNPIVTIILAVVFLKEKLTRIQTIACICVGISLLYLFISNFVLIQYNKPLITIAIDNAVLKSFLVFLAFSNMVNKSKEVDMKADSLLGKILRLMKSHHNN